MDDVNIEVVSDPIARVLQQHSITERIEMVGECNRTMRMVLRGRVRNQHPDWTESQVSQAVAERVIRGTA